MSVPSLSEPAGNGSSPNLPNGAPAVPALKSRHPGDFNAGVVSDVDSWADDLAASWSKLDESRRAEIQSRLQRLWQIAGKNGRVAARVDKSVVERGSGRMFAVGIALTVAWITVFAIGFTVPVLPYVKLLDSATNQFLSLPAAVGCVAVVILCSTPTNPGILACLAALLGGIANWIHVDGSLPSEAEAKMSLQRVCFAPMLRGFFMYLALLAGLLLLTTQAITNATQDQYVQLAGTVSVFGFMIGYDPDVFRKLMGKVNGWVAQREDAQSPLATAEKTHSARESRPAEGTSRAQASASETASERPS